jgi:hypothetical protein
VVAGSAAIKIAPKLMGKDKQIVRGNDKDPVRATLEKVVANTKNQRTKQDAEKLLGPAKGK